MPELKEEAKYLLRNLEAAARKKLGQNFMVDEGVLEFIANTPNFKKDEKVIEIGPGLGFLTRFLLSHGADVIAVEKDPAYVDFLKNYFKNKKFQVVEGDILETKISDLSGGLPVQVCANIPYNITSPILEWLILQKDFVLAAVLTVQWEVAERLEAKPGTKAWGPLSVFLRYHAEVSILKRIKAASFSPAPKVDSAVIRLTFLKKAEHEVKNTALFFSIVRRAFQKRRKTLLNALASDEDAVFSKKNLDATLRAIGVDPMRRPETLTLQEWANLTNQF